MKPISYLVPLGAWSALAVGIAHFTGYLLVGGKPNLAVAAAFLALSLSIKAYGNSIENKNAGAGRGRSAGAPRKPRRVARGSPTSRST